MKRRLVLKQLAMVSAAAWLLPSCVTDHKKLSVALNNLQITGDEEALIGQIADTIIPATDTPGATAVEAHLFALIMVDDCLGKTERESYLKGMRSFNETIASMTGKSFGTSSPEERLKALEQLEQQPEKLPADVATFYNRTRNYVLEGYLSSQHFLTNVKPYHLIPGPIFKGCVPVETKTAVL